MVHEGNFDYSKALRQIGMLSGGVQAGDHDPVLQALISGVTFTALCTREAIQAGISPDTAYSVGDSYIQSMVESHNIAEIGALNHAMYEDFIRRVHKHRTNPNVTPHVQACIDYIELHAEEPLSLKILANRTGYSEYHLSRKFHNEMGLTISRFIQQTRVDQSKQYLTNSDESIGQIADRFLFSSSSHYSATFHEFVGMKPSEYRTLNKCI